MPARFRASLSSGVVLAKDVEPCIAVWTPERRESILARAFSGLNPLSREHRRLSRYHEANSFEAELDATGRVTLPPALLEHAGIEREVVVAGVGDHLEVWARKRWDDEQQALDAQIEEVTDQLGHAS